MPAKRKPSPGTADGSYQRAYEKRQIESGAKRLSGLLAAPGVKALNKLRKAGYGESTLTIIAAALIEASIRHDKHRKTRTTSTKSTARPQFDLDV